MRKARGHSRVYRGRSVEELVPQIQRELGADAIIVRRRDGLTGGVLGFFQHPFVEIEAMSGPEGIDVYDDDEPVGPPDAPVPPQVELEPPPAIAPLPSQAPSPPQAPAPPVQRPAAQYGSSYVSARLAALARAAPAEGGFRSPQRPRRSRKPTTKSRRGRSRLCRLQPPNNPRPRPHLPLSSRSSARPRPHLPLQ